jgi:CRISPR-associated protein Cmr6
MNAPAVPDYVTKAAGNFDGCPPGHRFNLYFPIWKSDWQLDKTGKANALRQTLKLGSAAAVLTDLRRRQKALAEALGEGRYFILEARSTAPFATGLGLEHPIENGFAFLSPYGLPYLAGSGVKGVLRRAGEELEQEGELPPGTVDALFGPEHIREPDEARRGALSCWDVFPVPDKGEMVVEIMTPHFSHYYQPEKGKEQFATPHDAGKPTPIPFLAVPANSEFRFILTFEAELMPTALPENAWQEQIQKIITRAFDWLGFGAKTAVGYGAMEENPVARAERERLLAATHAEAARLAEEARRSALSPDDLAWEDHEPIVNEFRKQFDTARGKPYQPGSLFDNQRNNFLKTALLWTDSRSRQAAGELLGKTLTKAWGTPGNKEKKQRMQEDVAQLLGDTP